MDIGGSTVLVTGGAGLIGSHTVDRLLKEDVGEIIVFDRLINEDNLSIARQSKRVQVRQGDIYEAGAMDAAVQGADFVFHFAAMLLLPSARDPVASLKTNLIGTYRLLEAIGKHHIRKLVFGSSISIYGGSKDRVLMTEDYPFKGRSIYGATKIAAEQFCRVFHDTIGLRYLSLRYSSVYGPRQHLEGAFTGLIMRAIDRIRQGLPPQVEGEGDSVQDFIYVGDVAEANIQALKSDANDEAINIASGVPTTERELVQAIIDVVSPGLAIETLPARPNAYAPSRWVSVDKATRLLGFEAKTGLREGLKQVFEWRRRTGLGQR